MTEDELRRLFPNASRSCLELNNETTCVPVGDPRPVAVVERDPKHEPVGASEPPGAHSTHLLVSIKSVRKRLLDTDNLVGKEICDVCRYAGILDSDAPDKATVQVSQRKVRPGEKERTIVEIYEIL
jgi:hypothetical protein